MLAFLLTISLELTCRSAILVNADTGAILYQKNAHEKFFPASTTKIATCIYALSRSPNLDQEIIGNQECVGITDEKERKKRGYTLPPHRLEKAADHMGIKVGESLPLRTLFYGMMVSSACDASNLIAQTISGDIPLFTKEMNEFLKQIGCKNTHFLNPHGLYHPEHFSTAHDLAHMARVGLKSPFFRELVSSTHFIRPKTNKQESTKYPSTNQLIRPGKKHYYPHAIGIKTGWTSNIGHCLVAAAEKEGRTMISVVIGASSNSARFEESIALLEAGFNEKPIQKEVIKTGVQTKLFKHPTAEKKAVLKTKQSLSFETFPSEQEEVQLTFEWLPDATAGKFVLSDNKGVIKGEVLAEVDHWIEEEQSFSWAWASLLALPFGSLIFFRKK
jgi:D-alanyl-D-alanine carboxypeptidase (penicillin-binding protein 5/6)